MLSVAERYIVNKDGEKIGVMLDIEDFKHILTELEELDCIRAYDEAKASNNEAIPFEKAIQELEKGRL